LSTQEVKMEGFYLRVPDGEAFWNRKRTSIQNPANRNTSKSHLNPWLGTVAGHQSRDITQLSPQNLKRINRSIPRWMFCSTMNKFVYVSAASTIAHWGYSPQS
jgi:hypothetical protein